MAHMPFFAPESISDVLGPLAEVSDADFKILAREIAGPQALISDAARVRGLSEQTSLPQPYLGFLLSALSFLYNQLAEAVRAGTPFDDAVADLVETFNLQEEQVQAVQDRLRVLLSPNPNVERARKAQRLRRGFLPNALSFSSFVDLRPDFGDDRIVRLFPIVQMKIGTDADGPNERQLIFQIDEAGLTALEGAVARAREKIRMARQNAGIGVLIEPDRD